MAVLRNGDETSDVRLDRLADKDPRSRGFPVAAVLSDRQQRQPRSYTWRCDLTLDQGHDGACVGFAWAHELAARPAEVAGMTARFAREDIYFAAQRQDRFPGGAYPDARPFAEGTSVVAGAKAVAGLGFIAEYRWAFDFWDLVAAVGYRGPAVFGCRWYKHMQTPTDDGVASPTGGLIGHHCILVNGVKIVRDATGAVNEAASFFRFQNSFGAEWGVDGGATLPFPAIRDLWDGAETCIPVVRRREPTPPSEGDPS